LALLERVQQTGEAYVGREVEVRVLNGDALRTMFLNGTYQPIRNREGQIDRIMAFAYDVTEQVRARQNMEILARQLAQSEARARRLSDSGIIGVVFWTRDGRLVDANDAFLSMVGYSREELVEGRLRWSDMTPSEYTERDQQAFAELDANGVCTPYEKVYIGKDGRRVPILLGIACWEGTTDSGVAWILDVGARRAAEAERDRLLASERQARSEAEAANTAKDEFLAMISHELRTPLNAMLGWGRMLRSGTLDPERQKRALEAIERNAQAQAQLIEDLLDVSRIISKKLELELAPLQIGSVVEAAIDTVRPAIETKQIQLVTDLQAGLETMLGDAHRLQQVVWNLLSNAVKFTPNGGRITVSVRWDGARFVIMVSDTGQGISRGALPFIFETFRQADASITRSFGGLGLGLSISRHLVELHGGRIEAYSAGVGHGATFTVRLPPAPSFAPDARKPRRSLTPSSGGLQRPAELSGLRVLVVDDEADARELITTILSYAGASVSSAGSAAQALRILSETHMDVMLSDIGMPGQDGYDLIRRVRQLPGAAARIPAAALTAFARGEDRALAVAAGYHLHVAKPVDPIDLLSVVATLARIRPSSPPTR